MKLDRMRNKRRMCRFGEMYDSLCGQSLSSIGTTLRGTDHRDNHTIAKTAWTRFAAAEEIDRFEDFQPTIEHVHLRHRNARTVFFNARASWRAVSVPWFVTPGTAPPYAENHHSAAAKSRQHVRFYPRPLVTSTKTSDDATVTSA